MALGGVKKVTCDGWQAVFGGQYLAGGVWCVACGRWWAAYGGRNHDVGRYHSLNLIFRMAIATRSMIPPVQSIPVRGRAQSSPVQREGQTGLSHRLAVLDWTGSVWTDPNP